MGQETMAPKDYGTKPTNYAPNHAVECPTPPNCCFIRR